ncbi:protocatechuate 3,4-dioxygenase subunit beta [Amycolatopsis deserti]|uniref:Protocatechuate 3,4-dioxygenase subunit beta n=1 Tax=Amycolatopsis deserti TaxID=185696 RepID=A0ABQ3IEF7_9PSEU|nr:protocatechuate 3,4-dioxygenase subunit beta [Amycolatopsis deserti]GHE80552.1 protocatechuate 3,4-dioxygenase subunit beta [Amycolatopsis deserti]
MTETDSRVEMISPLMHPAFGPRIPTKELYELPPDWFHVGSGPVYGRVDVDPDDNNLLNKGDGPPLGVRIKLHGRVIDSDGEPVPGTLIEIWQANAGGLYLDEYCDRPWLPTDPNFFGTGRTLTDENGDYVFHTIKPSGYAGPAGSGMWRAPHVHFSFFGPNLSNRLITACYFENDPLNETDFVYAQQKYEHDRDKMIARVEDVGLDGTYLQLVYRWDVVLRGPGATPMDVE